MNPNISALLATALLRRAEAGHLGPAPTDTPKQVPGPESHPPLHYGATRARNGGGLVNGPQRKENNDGP